MKVCSYCGKENEDSSLICAECGQGDFKAAIAPVVTSGALLAPRKRRLTRIEPVRAGQVLGILYGIGGLLAGPLLLVAAEPMSGRASVILVMLMPVLYGVAGFVGGLFGAWLYNLVAKWTGGLEFEVSDQV